MNACSIPDQSLFQKGSGSLYEGGVSASELDSADTGESETIEDPESDTGLALDTSIEDTGFEDTGLEDTSIEDTGLEDTSIQDSAMDSGDTE